MIEWQNWPGKAPVLVFVLDAEDQARVEALGAATVEPGTSAAPLLSRVLREEVEREITRQEQLAADCRPWNFTQAWVHESHIDRLAATRHSEALRLPTREDTP
jgi:hypothetical protein